MKFLAIFLVVFMSGSQGFSCPDLNCSDRIEHQQDEHADESADSHHHERCTSHCANNIVAVQTSVSDFQYLITNPNCEFWYLFHYKSKASKRPFQPPKA